MDADSEAGLRQRLTRQLRKECSQGHVLATRTFACAARCAGCDSALFELDGGEWAVVHLTWQGTPSHSAFPTVEVVGSWDEVLPAINEHASGLHG